MTLRLKLMNGNRVIYEIPLEMNEWTKSEIEEELKLVEREIGKVCEIHEIFSSETRIRMLNNMIRNMDVRFSELMDQLNANQKIVTENLERLMDRNLINRRERNRRDVHYSASRLGFASFLAMATIRRVMDELRVD